MGTIHLIHSHPNAMSPLNISFVLGWVEVDRPLTKCKQLPFVSLAILQLKSS